MLWILLTTMKSIFDFFIEAQYINNIKRMNIFNYKNSVNLHTPSLQKLTKFTHPAWI